MEAVQRRWRNYLENHHNRKLRYWKTQPPPHPSEKTWNAPKTHPFSEISAERTVTKGDADGCSIFAPPATAVYIVNQRFGKKGRHR